jgi:hypothetical protein
MHGGKTPRGMALPQTTHGRYSRHLPVRLSERYRESQHDPDLLNLQHEIALTDARITELVERIDVDGAGQLWQGLGYAYGELKTAHDDDDPEALEISIRRIGQLIHRAQSDTEAWDEVVPLVEQRRKLVDSESKRRVQMQQMITADQAVTLVAALTDAVRRHVDDPGVLAAIAAEFDRLLTRPGADRLVAV